MKTDKIQTNLTFSISLSQLFPVILFTILIASGKTVCAADIFSGKPLYQSYCESCHGSDGQGVIPGTPNFKRGKGLMKSDRNIFEVVWNGKNSMPGFRGVMEKDEIFDIISYIRTFF